METGASNDPEPLKVSCFETPLNTAITVVASHERDIVALEMFDERKRNQ
jgi:hypothetical protein